MSIDLISFLFTAVGLCFFLDAVIVFRNGQRTTDFLITRCIVAAAALLVFARLIFFS